MKMTISKKWVGKMASLEADLPIGIGRPVVDTQALLINTPMTGQTTQQSVSAKLDVAEKIVGK